MRILASLFTLAVLLCAAKKPPPQLRNWKTGTVVDSASASDLAAVMADTNVVPGLAMSTAVPIYRESVGFVIRGDVYVFMVSCPILRRQRPNVTIHGTVRYSFERGKLYLIDENFVEFAMTVIKKALLDPPK